MNEISPVSIPDGEAAGRASPLPVLISFPFDQIVAALALAQLAIKPPRKTKHVVVNSSRTGRSYTYDYAPLDEVLAAVTKPLAENGLILCQPIIARDKLEIVLLHTSGQWMKTPVPLMPNADGFQDFGGAITSARRIGIQTLLSIAAEDDDDGNKNAGNDLRKRHWDNDIEAEQAGLHPLVVMARETSSIGHASELLDAWNSRGIEIGKLRTSDRARFDELAGEAKQAFTKTLGKSMAAAWYSALIAETPEQEAAISEKWTGAWADAVQGFSDAEPEAFRRLVLHMNTRRLDIERAARAAAQQAAGTPPGTDGAPTGRDAALATQRAAGDGFCFLILDTLGEPASDEITDPDDWAKAFAEMRSKVAPAERAAMDEFNADAIAEAAKSIGADIILKEAFELSDDAATGQPADGEQAQLVQSALIPVVDVPTQRGGTVNITAYLAALGSVIDGLDSADDLLRFELANGEVYKGEGMPQVVQVRVLKAIAGRKRALGIPLPSDG